MEPKLPTPENTPERAPAYQPEVVNGAGPEVRPETGLERGHERVEQRAEAAPRQATGVLPVPVVAPLPPAPRADDGTVTPIQGANPAVAADDDLIEKEWVDRAKKIIMQTKDDPYRREQEVSKLQADYLKKRYGKEMGAPQ